MRHACMSIVLLCVWLAAPFAAGGLAGEAPRVDRHGDPLPPGAVARLGTTRLRPGDFGQQDQVLAVHFTTSGRELLTGGNGKSIYRWDLQGKLLSMWPGPAHSYLSMTLAPDGKTLALQGLNLDIALVDPASGKERLRFRDHLPPNVLAHTQMCVLFTPDSRRVISATRGIDPFIRAWDAETGKEIYKIETGKPTLPLGIGTSGLALSPDGRTLYAASYQSGAVKVHDAATGKLLRQIGDPKMIAERLALSPNGRWLAVISHDVVHILDAATGAELHRLPRPRDWMQVAFSPDSRMIVLVSEDEPVRLSELATGQPRLEIKGQLARVYNVAFSPDGRLLATGSTDRTALLWDLRVLPLVAEKLPAPNFDKLWTDLASDDAKVAYRAICRLQGEGGKTVASLAERFPPGKSRQVHHLIAQLDDDDFQVREQATRELTALGRDAEAALIKALAETKSAEVRNRIKSIHERLDKAKGIGRLRSLRTLEVLEGIGTPAARNVLEVVAGGVPEAEMTVEARAALKRWTKRSK